MRLPITCAHWPAGACPGTGFPAGLAPAPAVSSSSITFPPRASAVAFHQALRTCGSEACALPIAQRASLRRVRLGVERCPDARARLFPRRVRAGGARTRHARVCRRAGQDRAEIAGPFRQRPPALWPGRRGHWRGRVRHARWLFTLTLRLWPQPGWRAEHRAEVAAPLLCVHRLRAVPRPQCRAQPQRGSGAGRERPPVLPARPRPARLEHLSRRRGGQHLAQAAAPPRGVRAREARRALPAAAAPVPVLGSGGRRHCCGARVLPGSSRLRREHVGERRALPPRHGRAGLASTTRRAASAQARPVLLTSSPSPLRELATAAR